MTVGVDRAAVETALLAGELGCPVIGCRGRLGPWGRARERAVRGLVGRWRPRRTRCGSCRRTHVLLPASVLLRRADAITVIGAAFLAKSAGAGHRSIAAGLGRPASTVRGWLRRLVAVADRVLAVLGVIAAEFGTLFVPPAPTGSPLGAVVELVGALARAAALALAGCARRGGWSRWSRAVGCWPQRALMLLRPRRGCATRAGSARGGCEPLR